VEKQAISLQNADQAAADAVKKAIMDADQADVRQLEAMESLRSSRPSTASSPSATPSAH
jgi:hypothetical protein